MIFVGPYKIALTMHMPLKRILVFFCLLLHPHSWADSQKVQAAENQNKKNLVDVFEKTLYTYQDSPLEVPQHIQQKIGSVHRDTLISSKTSPKFIVKNYLPFHRYWQSGDRQYRFHPQLLGGFLYRLRAPQPSKFLNAIKDVAIKVGNSGGIIWVYPDNYNVLRMQGRYVTSANSQGQIIGGLLKLSERNVAGSKELAHAAFAGLVFDYSQGGINLNGCGLLEIPLYDSAPEIILNGWLHGLLHLKTYADHVESPDALKLITNNIECLASNIHRFHHPATGLSLYSNLSPYRVQLTSDIPNQKFYFLYLSQNSKWPHKAIPIKTRENYSIYENHISSKRPAKEFHAWINIANGYRTYVLSSGKFKLDVDPGKYDPLTANHIMSNKKVSYTGERNGKYFLTELINKDGTTFFEGYPTNFLKRGENYYHVYHVVALAYILAEFPLSQNQRRPILQYLHLWHDAILKYKVPTGKKFSAFQDVIESIEPIRRYKWDELWQKATKVQK